MSPRLSQVENRIRELESLCQRLISWRATLEDRMDKQVRHGKVTDVDTKKWLARIEVANKNGTSVKSDWVPYAQVAGPDGQSTGTGGGGGGGGGGGSGGGGSGGSGGGGSGGGAGNGEYKFHNPPTVGQQMTLFSPNGDFRQAIVLPFTWYDKATSPSTATDTHVQTYGKQKIELKKDLWRSTVDKTIREQKTDTITDTVSNATITQKDGSIILKVGGSSIEITDGKINIDGTTVSISGKTYTGQTTKGGTDGAKVDTESGPALQHWSKT
jgi:phage baseplate assembly protein V